MEDSFGKYLRLFGTIFFSFIGFIIALVLLFLGIKLLFGLMNYMPWFSYVYTIFIILLPPTLFIPCYLVYFKRTAKHPSKVVRWISWILFSVATVAWLIFLFLDIIIFYKHGSATIGDYHGYDMIFLAANVACFFIVGVIQALTTEKEKDWMERSK